MVTDTVYYTSDFTTVIFLLHLKSGLIEVEKIIMYDLRQLMHILLVCIKLAIYFVDQQIYYAVNTTLSNAFDVSVHLSAYLMHLLYLVL